MADNLLDKASILLTPTAYNDGGMLSVKPENGDGDFTFSRNSAATRVNAQGLVENVQILSPELVSNGNFSQIGTEEVLNGNFSQEGSELVTNGDFATDSDWLFGGSASISNGSANFTGSGDLIRQNTITPVGTYKVTFTVTGTGYLVVKNWTGGVSYREYSNISEGEHTIYIEKNEDGIMFQSFGFASSIDNVSVKEVGQNWNLGTNWSISNGIVTSDVSGLMQQSTSQLTSGKTYKASFEITEYTSGKVKLYSGSGSDISPYQNTVGTHVFYFVPNGTTTSLYSNNFNGSITNISVKEVGQDWSNFNGCEIGENKVIYDGSLPTADCRNVFIAPSNKNYKVTYTVEDYVQGTHKVRISNYTSNKTGNGTFTDVINSGSGGIVRLYGTSNFIGSFTNISVKEITDDTNIPRINYEGFSYQDSLGSELVTNGDFSDGLNGWLKSGDAATTLTNINNKLVINAATSYDGAVAALSLTTGSTYLIKFNLELISASSVRVYFSGGNTGMQYFNSSQEVSMTIQADSLNSSIKFDSDSGTGEFSIDNVSIKEYLGQEVVPDSGCGSWLLEPQSTNLITHSEDFSDSSWVKKDTTIEVANITMPNGVINGYKLFANTSSTSHRMEVTPSPTATVGQNFTLSLFIKSAGSDFIQVASSTGFNSRYQNFNISTGTKASGDISDSSITDFGNGWYRISVTETTTGTSARYLIIPALSDITRNAIFQGNANEDGVYIWGAQLENQSYATSYVPTSGAANTRLQDIADNSGNSSLINSTEGVLYAEIAALAGGGSFRIISLSDGTDNNRVILYYDLNINRLSYQVKVSGVTQMVGSINNVSVLQFNKIALKYKENDFALWINGVEVATDTVGNIFPLNTLTKLSFSSGNGTSNFYGKNKALAVYKEALTDANLRSLTYPNPVATTFDLDFDTIAEQFTFTRGSEATFVNAQGLIESTASNDAPRIDYSTGEKAFLLEGQSTNIINYSEDFSQWNKTNVTITPNQGISPNGGNNASKYSGTSTNQDLRINANVSSNYTYSFYVKAINSPYIRLRSVDGNCWFNMTTNTVATNTFASAEIKSVGNDWYRLSVTSSSFTSSNNFFVHPHATNNTTSELSGGEFLLWGAQVEEQSYATSYIPTSGAAATRNQELCNNATPVINSEEGVLYFEASSKSDSLSKSITLFGQNANDRVEIKYRPNNTSIQVNVFSSGSLVFNGVVPLTIGLTNKIAVKYKQNDFALWVNGAEVLTGTSGNTPIGLYKLSFGYGDGGNSFFGNTKGLKYYPKALADVQLEALTTI